MMLVHPPQEYFNRNTVKSISLCNKFIFFCYFLQPVLKIEAEMTQIRSYENYFHPGV